MESLDEQFEYAKKNMYNIVIMTPCPLPNALLILTVNSVRSVEIAVCFCAVPPELSNRKSLKFAIATMNELITPDKIETLALINTEAASKGTKITSIISCKIT